MDRPAVGQFRRFDLLTRPLDLFQTLDFWYDHPIRTERQDRFDILGLQPGTDSVDAGQLFGAAKTQLAQCCRDGPARFGFAVQRHPVFHVHTDAVHVQRQGFFDLMPVISGHVKQGTSCAHMASVPQLSHKKERV